MIFRWFLKDKKEKMICRIVVVCVCCVVDNHVARVLFLRCVGEKVKS
jgi:hypothetical protein